jgi:hypothetical protein
MPQQPLDQNMVRAAARIGERFGVRAYPATTVVGGWLIEVVLPQAETQRLSADISALAAPFEVRFVDPALRRIVPQS